VEYQNNNHHLEMKPDHALILFRIIQECINNVIKHSRAKKIVLAVHENSDSIEVKVSDDGIGFREKDIYDGSGLKSMANRAKIINADFNIKSQENKGTDITVLYRKKNYGKD
ncbi:MAG: two-component sensor histidine kinase, partial [Flavobacteriales bacterium]|nr:two-component sensor histidine kinase [Flavobacteriales bacterium]